MYDITSSCADDFINHEEILDTLAYADQNKENSTLIDSIIQKAKKRKGLSHREKRFLWKPNCDVCTTLPVKLLYQWMYLLPLSCQK